LEDNEQEQKKEGTRKTDGQITLHRLMGKKMTKSGREQLMLSLRPKNLKISSREEKKEERSFE